MFNASSHYNIHTHSCTCTLVHIHRHKHNMIGNLKSETRKNRKLEAQISIFQRYESQTSHLGFANKRYTTLK